MIHALFLLVQIVFWAGPVRRLSAFGRQCPEPADRPLPPVSVVVCARNEAEHLRMHLSGWAAQRGLPEWELIVVDDASTDATPKILAAFGEMFPALRVLRLEAGTPRPWAGKKTALVAGISAARYERVLLTDADCAVGPDWAARMVSAFGPDTDVVLGFGPYAPEPGTLNRWIRFETLWTGIQYLSLARAGAAYMGVGRNVAYRKSAFLSAVPVFDERPDLPSGDDDLLVNRLARPGRTEVCLDPTAFTVSRPVATWRDWLRQKRRHLGTGKHYRPGHVAMLSVLSLSHFGSWWGLLCWPFFPPWETLFAAGLFTLRCALVAHWGRALARRLGEPSLAPGYLLYDAFFTLYYCLLFPFTLSGKSVRWK
jgi:cellulose synthase/poly-beta-1,6-N-acetylglucosamine synthase-like glycosyltransferase